MTQVGQMFPGQKAPFYSAHGHIVPYWFEIVDSESEEEELARMQRIAKKRWEATDESTRIFKQFGTWAVTNTGIDCLVYPYWVMKARLDEPHWVQHMSDKTWCDVEDFTACLEAGRQYHKRQQAHEEARAISASVRFRVLRRDGYRCQMCGRSADDGVRLHVDHKVPVAKGGGGDDANLWTLCEPCNLGKGVEDLGNA